MRKEEYCILNKQYSKEEYERLAPKIIEQMKTLPYKDSGGRQYAYGEYFPPALCPFAYNETVAQEFYPLSRQEVSTFGSFWKEPETKEYGTVVQAKDLPPRVEDVQEDITKEIIGCEHEGDCEHGCAKAFKITPAELQFYKRTRLPLPHLCHNCRHHGRLAMRNSLKLNHRQCMCQGDAKSSEYKNTAEHFHGSTPCVEEFETTYPDEGSNIVYCERCYQAEVN